MISDELKDALITLALERGYKRMAAVDEPDDPERLPDGVFLLAQSDTHPSVYATDDEDGEILLCGYMAGTIENDEDRAFRAVLDAAFGEIPDQYAQGIAYWI
jgi:hypothetical protein